MLTTRDKELLSGLLIDPIVGGSEDIKQPILIVPKLWSVEDCLDHINSGDSTIMWIEEEV